MKKAIALAVALAAVMSLSACGGDEGTTSSTASTGSTVSTPSIATPSADTSSTVIIVPPVSTPDEDDGAENLALSANASVIDMNTGKAEGDEGYIKYYGGTHTPDLINDENTSTGWQTEALPDGSDNFWLGIQFEEAVTVDMVVLQLEKGSTPSQTYADGAYRIEYTADGTEWKSVENATVERTENGDIVVDAASFDAVELKGVRVVLLVASGEGDKGYCPKIWEFEVYAPVEEDVSSEATSETVSE